MDEVLGDQVWERTWRRRATEIRGLVKTFMRGKSPSKEVAQALERIRSEEAAAVIASEAKLLREGSGKGPNG